MLQAIKSRKPSGSRVLKERILSKQLAQTMLNGLGYDEALRRAKTCRWDDVARNIHFLASKKAVCS